ncbi:MAG: lipoate--protein ligase family protein [Planctomycetota bacterium]|nr:MAG: lipoate--protein ligase family protein [Planctomycetota bacterium]
MHHVQLWIDDRPHGGAENMAYDEALLEAALDDELCCVRVYRWARPTVSLGYFQSFDQRLRDRFAGLPVVRRLSGGGALIHDREITYSLVIPPRHPFAAAPLRLYDAAHQAVVSVLRMRNVPARLRGAATSENPFLCFGRGDPRDVLVHGHKVMGSAQRRRRGAVLQHGALLLRRSVHAPQFPGLLDLIGRTDPPLHEGLDAAIGWAIASRLGRPQAIHRGELPADLHRRAASLIGNYEALDPTPTRHSRPF